MFNKNRRRKKKGRREEGKRKEATHHGTHKGRRVCKMKQKNEKETTQRKQNENKTKKLYKSLPNGRRHFVDSSLPTNPGGEVKFL
jgi:hypothetical protein